ncbi:MAG: class I SAM-dependent methyltransferase [Candidatus Omnitrophica bacterium]|nr:class I SAM-dependent methyltransferase [Candidatus Omnitrophota bacterium]
MDKSNESVLTETGIGVHEKIMELLAPGKKGALLDAGAGQGFLSEKLQAAGFSVYATDLDLGKFKVPSIECRKADLNEDLPFQDSFFDHVICVETIEHLENPHHLIREFRRVLKPGGDLVIATPNILNIHARLRYLLRGSPDWLHAEVDKCEAKNLYEYLRKHINPMGFIELRHIFKENGLNVDGIHTNRSVLSDKSGNAYLRPFMVGTLFMLAKLISALTLLRYGNSQMECQLISKELLLGEVLILKGTKN